MLGRGATRLLGAWRAASSSTTTMGRSPMSDWVAVNGMLGSPYTRKLMSALRYKHVPFTFHHLMPGNVMGDWEDRGFAHIKPKVKC